MCSEQADSHSTMADDMHVQASSDGGSLVRRGVALAVNG